MILCVYTVHIQDNFIFYFFDFFMFTMKYTHFIKGKEDCGPNYPNMYTTYRTTAQKHCKQPEKAQYNYELRFQTGIIPQ